jgi:hypothetical protein
VAITEHSKFLSILEHRAHQFCPEIRLVLENNDLAQQVYETRMLQDFKVKQDLKEREGLIAILRMPTMENREFPHRGH